jgi:hypothetical protein
VRRTAGNGIELMGILAFHASPVWVLAALADASGAGNLLIREITNSLKQEGLLDADANFDSVEEMLNGLEASAGRMADTVNAPPLDVATLRKDLEGNEARSGPNPAAKSALACQPSEGLARNRAGSRRTEAHCLSGLVGDGDGSNR